MKFTQSWEIEIWVAYSCGDIYKEHFTMAQILCIEDDKEQLRNFVPVNSKFCEV